MDHDFLSALQMRRQRILKLNFSKQNLGCAKKRVFGFGDWKITEVAMMLFSIILILFIYGAIPFLMLPSTGIVGWAMGFALSMANGGLFDFYSHDFGIPKPAAIAFGLAGAWPASLLIRIGLSAADAYAMMAALWLLLALFSAFRIVGRFGGNRLVAILGAVTWMSTPIIWNHAGYAMLSLGVALLSFYFMVSFKLFLIGSKNKKITPGTIVLYGVATLISVFMDGYTFVMFATGASILLIYAIITVPDVRSILLKISMPVHIVSFTMAYYLYTLYIGKSNFAPQSLDIFRGWGLDLTFLAIPTKGVLWLPDFLRVSVNRSDQLFFGDASVYATTFALPYLIFGLGAWYLSWKRIKIVSGILLVSIFSFYMALGPSLKINSLKPRAIQVNNPNVRVMTSEYAIAPTGNSWISDTLPGFNVMRASYRWSALGIFALWILIIIFISTTNNHLSRASLIFLLIVLLFNLPNFQKKFEAGAKHRAIFQQIDQYVIPEFRQKIKRSETVSFLPWGNDFFANYLAPKVGFRTYNTGGDKNIEDAKSDWPNAMVSAGNTIDEKLVSSTLIMLLEGATDVVVLPYFDLMSSAFTWPCRKNSSTAGFACPPERKAQFEPIITQLKSVKFVDVADSDLFSTIRLNSAYSSQANKSNLLGRLLAETKFPIEMTSQSTQDLTLILESGWSQLENTHVWSRAEANLRLPIPEECLTVQCLVKVNFFAHGASPKRPVEVIFKTFERGRPWAHNIKVTTSEVIQLNIPLDTSMNSQKIKILVPNATSPMELNGSPDRRILGLALTSLELIKR